MVGKGLRFLVLTALAVHVARQRPDVVRYLKIKQLSVGRGHPEDVPARGRASHPQRPGSGGQTAAAASTRPGGAAHTARDDAAAVEARQSGMTPTLGCR
jgi:hypothetical protein